ncbi:hypothetical protein [Saccharothrix stipae]
MAKSALGFILALALSLIWTVPASGATYEVDYVVAGTPGAGATCFGGSNGAQVCYNPTGDRIWVHDTASDGASAVAQWQNYLDGDNTIHRHGECRNSLGAGSQGACNKNFQEGTRLYIRACRINFSTGSGSCDGFVLFRA